MSFRLALSSMKQCLVVNHGRRFRTLRLATKFSTVNVCLCLHVRQLLSAISCVFALKPSQPNVRPWTTFAVGKLSFFKVLFTFSIQIDIGESFMLLTCSNHFFKIIKKHTKKQKMQNQWYSSLDNIVQESPDDAHDKKAARKSRRKSRKSRNMGASASGYDEPSESVDRAIAASQSTSYGAAPPPKTPSSVSLATRFEFHS